MGRARPGKRLFVKFQSYLLRNPFMYQISPRLLRHKKNYYERRKNLLIGGAGADAASPGP